MYARMIPMHDDDDDDDSDGDSDDGDSDDSGGSIGEDDDNTLRTFT